MASCLSSRGLKAIGRCAAISLPLLLAACSVPLEHPLPEAPISAPTLTVPVAPAVTAPETADTRFRETGLASWSGREKQGVKTASGELFDMNGLTAGHRTLPLGTALRVTNSENSKNIVVRIIERGPLVAGRILDLSYAAARELGCAGQGVCRVGIESLEPVPAGGTFTVQAAVFTEEENAKLLKEWLQQRFETVSVLPLETPLGRLYRVRVGSYATLQRAEAVAAKLLLEGLEPVVIRKDQP